MGAISIPIGQASPTQDRKLISDALSLDRVWSSEALKSLDDSLWSLSSWYGYTDGTNLGLMMVLKNLSPTPVFLTGEPNCLSHLIRPQVLPKRIFVEAPTSCVGIFKSFYEFDSALVMNKMVLKHFRPNTFAIHPLVRRLEPSDFPRARDLYYRNADGHFDADQFQSGIYFGVEHQGEIVSMSGTTVLCPDYRTATIGNVITDTAHRHNGYATSELLLLCQKLIEAHYDCITIKVNRGNVSAITLYRRIGFSKVCDYFEGLGLLKEGAGETMLRKDFNPGRDLRNEKSSPRKEG